MERCEIEGFPGCSSVAAAGNKNGIAFWRVAFWRVAFWRVAFWLARLNKERDVKRGEGVGACLVNEWMTALVRV